MNTFKSTRHQGDFGVAAAIHYFTKNEYCVSIPLSDNQLYDIVIGKDNNLQTVQVKSSIYKGKYGGFQLQLKRVRPNTKVNTIHKFDNNEVDIVFAVTGDDKYYCIPAKDIDATSSITLPGHYPKYEVFI